MLGVIVSDPRHYNHWNSFDIHIFGPGRLWKIKLDSGSVSDNLHRFVQSVSAILGNFLLTGLVQGS